MTQLGIPNSKTNLEIRQPKYTLPEPEKKVKSDISKDPKIQIAAETYLAAPSPQTLSPLVSALKPQMSRTVRKHIGADDSLAMGKAKSLLVKSLPRYDSRKASIETFVDRQLQPLIRWHSQRSRKIRLPHRMQIDAAKISQAIRDIEDEYGHPATTYQIADHTGLAVRRIEQVRKADKAVVDGSSLVDSVGGESTTTFDELATADDPRATQSWLKIVHADLGRIDQLILEHTAGLDGATIWSNKELARRLKLSPGAISQRKARIQALIDQEFELSPFR